MKPDKHMASNEEIIKKMVNYLITDKRILAAWVFGSFAREEMSSKSDIDLILRFDEMQNVSLFDFADIVYKLEKISNRKIDLVEEGQVKSFAVKSAERDMFKIYDVEEGIPNLL